MLHTRPRQSTNFINDKCITSLPPTNGIYLLKATQWKEQLKTLTFIWIWIWILNVAGRINGLYSTLILVLLMGKSSLIDSSIFAGIKSFSISFVIVKVLCTISSHLDKRISNKVWFFNRTKFITKVDRNYNFIWLSGSQADLNQVLVLH